ncbi:ImmA/IrrE family metallo-endopeptidase [Nocardioides marmoriginsengisoli]|nr:ImmA/IrrE family metallo-endopeptidase [Nocardioides marmoriginsengisoli]
MADREDGSRQLSYDPRADIARRHPDWIVGTGDLGGLIPEVLCPVRRVILLERSLSPVVRRCSLAHAIAHIDLDHTHPVTGHYENREEAAANVLAARRLIPLRDYAAALTWTREPAEVAAELVVDAATLRVRESGLTTADRRTIRGLLRRCVREPA